MLLQCYATADTIDPETSEIRNAYASQCIAEVKALAARFDLRELTERATREKVEKFISDAGCQNLGPVRIYWTYWLKIDDTRGRWSRYHWPPRATRAIH